MSYRHIITSAYLLASPWVLGAAEEAKPSRTRGILEFHTAAPLGDLAADVNNQFGFGLGLGTQMTLGSHAAFRASGKWTGYRVSDRHFFGRLLANLLDARYEEDVLILRSYALGGDLLIFSEPNCTAAYLLAGGGVQRSRLYAEVRSVDEEGNETSRVKTQWPAVNTPYVNFGVGYQGQHTFIEGRLVWWQYHAARGVRLMNVPINAQLEKREALSLVIAVGARISFANSRK